MMRVYNKKHLPTTNHQPPTTMRKGFTLIEMVIVIIIVAVMTSVIVPAYARFYARANYDGQVRQVQDVFAYAREQALQRDTNVTLNFSPQTESFDVTLLPPPPPTDQPTAYANSNADTSTLTQSHTVQLASTVGVVGFTATDTSQGIVPGGSASSSSGGRGLTTVNFRSDGTSDGAEMTVVSAEGNFSTHLILHPGNARMTVDDAQSGQNR